ncbi:MAG: alanine racemase [Thermaerobacter sp.]|nr:alanine racemase [Thermaerobacter sp.]
MRAAFIEIDLRRIALNLANLAGHVPGASVMAVVKANAYGHGAVPVSQAALQAGAEWLGVATIDEAEELRHAGILAPILTLGHVRPEEYELCARRAISTTISEPEQVAMAERGAMRGGRPVGVHLKLDTGMGRIGARPSDAVALAQQVARSEHLRLEGVFSHFASAGQDDGFTRKQTAQFTTALQKLERQELLPPWRHIQNSAGILLGPIPGVNLVRAGIAMYGLHPDGVSPPPTGLAPALSLHARVTFVKRVPRGTPIGYGGTFVTEREMQIATLGVGYADGYRRGLSGRARVLLGGMHWRVAGRVSMDQTTIAVDSDFPVAAGDEAVLIGRQGDREVSAEELARVLGTINYEIVTGLSTRLPRVYRPRN